ncbi:MAG TPA: thiamine pyrophosphate-binding protein [Parvularculaceae bacterium]|nr:thiamine pyrophosphate-binding protein [Parvularculaceae bacterium]
MSGLAMKGADALLCAIRANGVDTIFGLPGGQLNDFFDAMHRAGNGVSYVGSRHEQGAAYMAFGYAKSTGKVGVYTVVPGPGVLNTTAAICSAYANSAPVLCVTGQIPSHAIGRGVGELHELPDQLATLRSLTKWAARIDHPSQVNSVVNDAFREMTIGRPRPVAIEMPPDIMAMRASDATPSAFSSDAASIFDQDLVAAAAKAVAASKAPLIVVGGGAQHASEEVRRLAELIQAPVVSFRNGRGVVSDEHPLGCNFIAGYDLWKTADLVIGIGSRLQPYLQEWGVDDEMTLIRIDWDPTEINRIVKADIGICGDAKNVASALADECARVIGKRAARTDEIAAVKARAAAALAEIPEQKAYLDAIRAELPENGILVDEITQVGFASWIAFPVYRPRSLITCGYQGTLGYGYATALGVKVANPDKAVVAIAGDGGFMFQVQELATAAQYGINLPVIVFNNGKFGNVRRHQEEWYDGRYIGSELKNPRFAEMAETFGVAGYKANSPQALRSALGRALKENGPSLIEVEVGEMSSPWKFILRDRARGKKMRH